MFIFSRFMATFIACALTASLSVGFTSPARAESVDDGALVVILYDDECETGLSGSIGSSSVSVSESPFTGILSGSIGSSRVSVSKSPFTGILSGSIGSNRVSLRCGSSIGGAVPVTPPAPPVTPPAPPAQPTAPEPTPSPATGAPASQPDQSGGALVITDPAAIAAALADKPTPGAIYGFPSGGMDIPPQPNAYMAARKGKKLRVSVMTNASDKPVQVPQVTIRVYDSAKSTPRCEKTYIEGQIPPSNFVCNWKFPWGERNYSVYAVTFYDGGYIAQPSFRMPDMTKRWW